MKKVFMFVCVFLLLTLVISSCTGEANESSDSSNDVLSGSSETSLDNSGDNSSKDTSDNSSEDSDDNSLDTSSENSSENSSETSEEPTAGINNEFTFKVKDDMPEYKCEAVMENYTVKEVIITDNASGEAIQKIEPIENFVLTKNAVYFIDITFDGALDILISNNSGRIQNMLAYVWDNDKSEFTYMPEFQEMGKVAVDSENKRILTNNTIWLDAQRYSGFYSMWSFDGEKYVLENQFSWTVSEDLKNYIFKETKGEEGNQEIIAEFELPAEGTTFDKTNEKLKAYYEDGSFWGLDGSKWESVLITDKLN